VDLPSLSYQVSPTEALHNAGKVMKETGAHAVKLEGGDEGTCETVKRLVRAGIPVMGHLGFVPQSVHALGGALVQGRAPGSARRLRDEAKALEEAGCFAVVLELVAGEVAAQVSKERSLPTIGIGSGVGCDGQVLVLPDALGMNPGFTPRFLRRFANVAGESTKGVKAFIDAVKSRSYPGPEHTFGEEA
jgi:3-methyl-2-oxobutanoate hydroxymethyltransferase